MESTDTATYYVEFEFQGLWVFYTQLYYITGYMQKNTAQIRLNEKPCTFSRESFAKKVYTCDDVELHFNAPGSRTRPLYEVWRNGTMIYASATPERY